MMMRSNLRSFAAFTRANVSAFDIWVVARVIIESGIGVKNLKDRFPQFTVLQDAEGGRGNPLGPHLLLNLRGTEDRTGQHGRSILRPEIPPPR
jgi:hypothetical protein